MRYLWIGLVCLAFGPAGSAAQVVRGEVLEEGTGTPVGGAMVVLVETGADPVRRVLTDARGSFIVQAPHPGRYEIRVDRIGYATLVTDPFDVPPAGTHRTVEVPVRPIELTGIDVSGARRCEVRPEEGRVTARVWEEVRKALQAAAWTEESGVYRYTLLRYVREYDRDARRLLSEDRRFMQGSTVAPFVSLSAEELVAGGFVQSEGDSSLVYHAPDAEALLSDGFLDTHCMAVRRGEDGELGLAFEPVEGRRLPEIEGVLWIDERTGFLRRLEFRYVNLGRLQRSGDASGEVVFAALPSGTWIVREFRIRMPNLERARSGRLRRIGYRDEGGIAWRIIDARGEIVLEAATATLSGTVVDSAGGAPSPPARVRIAELGDERATAPDGSFLLPTLPAGPHVLELRHPSLDTLGVMARTYTAEAVLGEIVAVPPLTLPGPSEALAAACPPPEAERPGGGVVFGRVREGSGAPAAAVRVRVSWLGRGDISVPALAAPPGPSGEPALEWSAGFEGAYEAVETTTDARGIFMLCHAPERLRLRVEASREGSRGSRTSVWVPRAGEVETLTLTIEEGGGP